MRLRRTCGFIKEINIFHPLVYSIGTFSLATTKTSNTRLRAHLAPSTHVATHMFVDPSSTNEKSTFLCTHHVLAATTIPFCTSTVHPPCTSDNNNTFLCINCAPTVYQWQQQYIPMHTLCTNNNINRKNNPFLIYKKCQLNLLGSSFHHFDIPFKVKM